MANEHRRPLDAATDMTVAYIQSLGSFAKAPVSPEKAAEFFLEVFKAAFKAENSNSKWRQQEQEEL